MNHNRYHLTFNQAVSDFISDDVMTGGAALAFYAALSLAPLVLFFVSVAGLINAHTGEVIVEQFTALIGPHGAETIAMIVEGAQMEKQKSFSSSILSILILMFSGSAVFAQFQSILNRIFRVEAKPGIGIISWFRQRVFSVGMLFALGFLMIISLMVSTGLQLVSFREEGILWETLNLAISTGVFSFFFAAVYKYLPDVTMAWRDVWIGALLTGVLFSLGKAAIGIYLGNSAVGSAYGAAGSLIVLLIWVYYSSLIILFGAELTRLVAQNFGRGTKPKLFAVSLRSVG